MQAEVRNPRWRLTEIGNTHFSPCIQHICTILTAKHTYIKAKEFSEAIPYIVWCKRKSEIQDGGLHTGNTDISACIQRSCKIPTSKHMFSSLRIWMKLFSILCNASGYQKSKMVAYKPEVLISQAVYIIAERFQRQYPCFQGRRTQ